MKTKIAGIFAERTRQGWVERFRNSGTGIDDEFLLKGLEPNTFDSEEWEW